MMPIETAFSDIDMFWRIFRERFRVLFVMSVLSKKIQLHKLFLGEMFFSLYYNTEKLTNEVLTKTLISLIRLVQNISWVRNISYFFVSQLVLVHHKNHTEKFTKIYSELVP